MAAAVTFKPKKQAVEPSVSARTDADAALAIEKAKSQLTSRGPHIKLSEKAELLFAVGKLYDEWSQNTTQRQERGLRRTSAIDWYSQVIDLSTGDDWKARAYLNRGLVYCARSAYGNAVSDTSCSIALRNARFRGGATSEQALAESYAGRASVYRRVSEFGMELKDLLSASTLATGSLFKDCNTRSKQLLSENAIPPSESEADAIYERIVHHTEYNQKRKRPAAAAEHDQPTEQETKTPTHQQTEIKEKEKEKERDKPKKHKSKKAKLDPSESAAAAAAATAAETPHSPPEPPSPPPPPPPPRRTKPAAAAPPVSASDSKTAPPLQLITLTVAGVSDYVRSIDPAYVKSFADNKINGAALCKLSDSLLAKLGVSNEFHRIRILADTELSQRTFVPAPAAASTTAGGGGGAASTDSISADAPSSNKPHKSSKSSKAAATTTSGL